MREEPGWASCQANGSEHTCSWHQSCNKILSGTQEKQSLAKELIIAYCFLRLFPLYIFYFCVDHKELTLTEQL